MAFSSPSLHLFSDTKLEVKTLSDNEPYIQVDQNGHIHFHTLLGLDNLLRALQACRNIMTREPVPEPFVESENPDEIRGSDLEDDEIPF